MFELTRRSKPSNQFDPLEKAKIYQARADLRVGATAGLGVGGAAVLIVERGSFAILGVRVDAVQIPDVIGLMERWIAARAEYEAKYTPERN
jgi:hypothetical protein